MKGFNKKGWTKTTFGEVSINVNETEKDPLGKGIERYIGLEHIETENLHIKTWGNVADGTTFTKTFKKGQVLFGKRRAYLKKAALAEFNGLCSGDILVFEANEKIIDKNLFPFLIKSDRFFDYAVQTSAGSLSPRTKFQDLAKFEFLLPSKEEQAQLAELLWAADEVVEQYEKLLKREKLLIDGLFSTVYESKVITELLLDKCLEFSQYGISDQLEEQGEVPVLRMNNLQEKKVLLHDLKYINRSKVKNLDALLLKKGDILFNRTNSYDLVGKVGIFDSDGDVTFASYLIRLRADKKIILPEYLNTFLNSNKGQSAIKKHRTPGVSQSNINPENLKKIKVPVISIKSQEILLAKINMVENSVIKNERLLLETTIIRKQLINQIFST